jgi:alpha-1,3-mannosyltransferase
MREKVKFRNGTKGDCYARRLQLFRKDMQHKGHRKVAVVRSINLQYTDEKSKTIKLKKRFVSDNLNWNGSGDRIDWMASRSCQMHI